MFTGIVQASLPLASLVKKTGLFTFSFEFLENLREGLELGASVAINGVCCTVTRIEGHEVFFDAMAETLQLTNISEFATGDMVNIERSAKAGDEIGGHLMSGHVTGTANVIAIEKTENNCRITFALSPEWTGYIFHKGFLALNGASLTVASIDKQKSEVSVTLIPETLQRTNFSLLTEGDRVNVEIDQQTQAIVDTVSRVLKEKKMEEVVQSGCLR